MTTSTTNTTPDDQIEAELKGLWKWRKETLEELGIEIERWEYKMIVKDQWWRDRIRTIWSVTDPPGKLESYILKELWKQVDLVDLTQNSSHDQVIQLLDTYTETGADIDKFDFSAPSEAPFDSMEDAFGKVRADAGKYLNYLWEAVTVGSIPALAWTSNMVSYTPTGWSPKVRHIHDIIIELFQKKKVYNKDIGEYLYGRTSRERKAERARARQERTTRTGNTSQTWIPENPTTIPNAWTNATKTLNEELSIPQLYAACEQAKKKPDAGSAYSFDKKWFYVRYDGTRPANEKFHAQYQKKDWTLDIAKADTIGEIVAKISTSAEKKETKEMQPLVVDMWESFSRTEFTKLCEAVHNQKKRGEYKLGGKNYFVEERLTGTPPAPYPIHQYTISYPGHTWVLTTGDHVHTKTGDKDPTLPYLIEFLEWHHGIYNPHHDLDRKTLLQKISDSRWWVFGKSVHNKKASTYIVKGHEYALWSKRRGGGGVKMEYFAEVPSWEHGKRTVSAWTKEGLYDKIVESVQWGHSHDKPAEWAATPAHAETAHAPDAAHPAGAHPASEGTFYDRSVENILGHGLLGKAFIGLKNFFPKKLREIAGGTTVSVKNWALAGAGVWLTGAGMASLGIGWAAAVAWLAPLAAVATFGYYVYQRMRYGRKGKEENGAKASEASH